MYPETAEEQQIQDLVTEIRIALSFGDTEYANELSQEVNALSEKLEVLG